VLQNTLDRLKGGVSRRVEMEMAVLRLCDPKLDDTKAALLHRVEVLENALKNGAVMNGAPRTSPPTAPVEPAAEPAPDTPDTETIPAPIDAPPAPEAEVMPAIPAPAAPLPAPAGETPFDGWVEVLDYLRQSCPPLFGLLDGTTALLKESSLVICTDNPLLAQLLKEGGNKQQLQEAIRHVTGRTYQMALRRKQQVKKPEFDPLSQLLTAGRGAGIDISENE